MKKSKRVIIWLTSSFSILSFAISFSFISFSKNTNNSNELNIKNKNKRNTSQYINNISCDLYSQSIDTSKYYKDYNFSSRSSSANINISYNDNSQATVSISNFLNMFENGENFSIYLPTVELAKQIKLNVTLDLELIWKEYNAILNQRHDLDGGSVSYTSPYTKQLSYDFNNFDLNDSSLKSESIEISNINSTTENWNESNDGELTNVTKLDFDYQYVKSNKGAYDNYFLLKNMQAITNTTRVNNQTTKYGYVYFNDTISNFKLTVNVPDTNYLISFVNDVLKKVNINVTQDFYTLQKSDKLSIIEQAMNEYIHSTDFESFLTSQKIYINNAFSIKVKSDNNVDYSFALDFGQPNLQYTNFINLDLPSPTPDSLNLNSLTGYQNIVLTEDYFLSNKSKIELDINKIINTYNPNDPLISNTISRIESLGVENIDTKNGMIKTNLLVNKYVNEERVLINAQKSIPISISGFKPCNTETYINKNSITYDVSKSNSNILASSFTNEQIKNLIMSDSNFIKWNYDSSLSLAEPKITNIALDADNTIGTLNIYNITFNGLYNDKGTKINSDIRKNVNIKITGFKTVQPTPKQIEFQPSEFTTELNFNEDISNVELNVDLLENKKTLIEDFLRNSSFAKSLPSQVNPIPEIFIQANSKNGQIIATMELACYYNSKGIPVNFESSQIYGNAKAVFNGFKKVQQVTEVTNDTKVETSQVAKKEKDYKWLWIGLCVGIPILIILIIILSIVFVSINNNKKMNRSEYVIRQIREGNFGYQNKLLSPVDTKKLPSNQQNKKQLSTNQNNSRKSLTHNQNNNRNNKAKRR